MKILFHPELLLNGNPKDKAIRVISKFYLFPRKIKNRIIIGRHTVMQKCIYYQHLIPESKEVFNIYKWKNIEVVT